MALRTFKPSLCKQARAKLENENFPVVKRTEDDSQKCSPVALTSEPCALELKSKRM